jgi:cytochrome c-type biogenesis protein CcsB
MLTKIFNITFSAYIRGLFLAALALFSRHKAISFTSLASMLIGTLTLTAYIILRWQDAGRAPFSNMFESLVLFAWAIVAVYLILRIRINIPVLSAAVALLALLVLAYASAFFESDIKPLMPALQSNWLSVHVFTCFLGYAGFAISFLSSIGYLIAARSGSKIAAATRESLDIVTAKTISFGFLFLAIGIITGAVWANSAWGTYWSWDPKETWSFITWLIYAVYLHCRYMHGWHGKRSAWISVIGFASVIFTYIGVNFLLPGLHSYA